MEVSSEGVEGGGVEQAVEEGDNGNGSMLFCRLTEGMLSNDEHELDDESILVIAVSTTATRKV